MAASSPTQRTLAKLHVSGYVTDIVEYWHAHAGVRKDLYGCIDVIACGDGAYGRGIIGVQATSASNHSARVTKSLAIPALKVWLESGGRFQVWSWGRKGKQGEKKRWRVRIEEVRLSGDEFLIEKICS